MAVFGVVDYARVEYEEALCRECGSDEKIVDPDERLCARCTGYVCCWACGAWGDWTARTAEGPICPDSIVGGDPLAECVGCGVLYEGAGLHCPECYAIGLREHGINEAVRA